MCTKFHWCLIKNNKVIEVWNFFYKSAFWLVGLDGKIMDLHQQNFSGQYWGVKLTCIPNFSEIGQFLQKLSHFIEFRLVGWLGWLGPSDFKKISRWKADGHNISAYKKSSWYLKAFKSYPIFKVGDNDHNDDDADTIGGWIIVCAESGCCPELLCGICRSKSSSNSKSGHSKILPTENFRFRQTDTAQ